MRAVFFFFLLATFQLGTAEEILSYSEICVLRSGKLKVSEEIRVVDGSVMMELMVRGMWFGGTERGTFLTGGKLPD